MTNKTNITVEDRIVGIIMISVILGITIGFVTFFICIDRALFASLFTVLSAIIISLIRSDYSVILKHINNAKNNP